MTNITTLFSAYIFTLRKIRKMLRRAGIYLLLLVLPFNSKAIDAVANYTIFYLKDKAVKGSYTPYAEIYWQINPAKLNFNNTDFSTRLQTDIVFRNDTGIVGGEHFILQTPKCRSVDEAYKQNIMELHRYMLPHGKIYVDLRITELGHTDNIFTYNDSFTTGINGNVPFYSGIELVDTSYKDPNEKTFLRNDIAQIPLYLNYIDENRHHINYYAELYNSPSSSEKLIQHTFISKHEADAAVMGLEHTDTIHGGDIIPITGYFDISALPSGNYYLNMILIAPGQPPICNTSVFFQRNNTNLVQKRETTAADTGIEKVTIFDISSTFVNKYTPAQLRAILKMIMPIGSPLEINAINAFLDRPDEMYMRYFIYNFWKARNDKDPKKEWEIYTERVKEVNKIFGSGTRPGYETERGNVWLKYGKPDERIIVESEQGSLPYELWQYNHPGKQSSPGVFLFYRPGYMINDYLLLHSTVTGETRNAAWRNMLYTSGNTNTNARAERYIPQGR